MLARNCPCKPFAVIFINLKIFKEQENGKNKKEHFRNAAFIHKD